MSCIRSTIFVVENIANRIGFILPVLTQLPKKSKKYTPCLFQCIFMHSGLSTSDGDLNEKEITKKMSEGMNNDEKFKSLWQQTLDHCFDEVKDEDKKIVPMMNTPAGRLMKCFLRDLYMNCPKSEWDESSECSSIKYRLQKCPEMPPPVFKALPKLI